MHDGIAPPDPLKHLLHYVEQGRPRSKAERQEICMELCEDARIAHSALAALSRDYLARAEGLQCAHQDLADLTAFQERCAVTLAAANLSAQPREILQAELMLCVFAKALSLQAHSESDHVAELRETRAESNNPAEQSYLTTALQSYEQAIHNTYWRFSNAHYQMQGCLDYIRAGVDEDFVVDDFEPTDDLWLENPELGVADLIPSE